MLIRHVVVYIKEYTQRYNQRYYQVDNQAGVIVVYFRSSHILFVVMPKLLPISIFVNGLANNSPRNNC